jgi:hypothetical protein
MRKTREARRMLNKVELEIVILEGLDLLLHEKLGFNKYFIASELAKLVGDRLIEKWKSGKLE